MSIDAHRAYGARNRLVAASESAKMSIEHQLDLSVLVQAFDEQRMALDWMSKHLDSAVVADDDSQSCVTIWFTSLNGRYIIGPGCGLTDAILRTKEREK